jgi:hypothetical protein
MLMMLPQIVLESMLEAEKTMGLSGEAKKAVAMAGVRRRLQERAAADGHVTLSEELIMALVPPFIERMVAVQNGALDVNIGGCCAGLFKGMPAAPLP